MPSSSGIARQASEQGLNVPALPSRANRLAGCGHTATPAVPFLASLRHRLEDQLLGKNLPGDRLTRNLLLANGLQPILASLGFERDASANQGVLTFRRDGIGIEIQVFASAFGAAWPSNCDIVLNVRVAQVHHCIDRFMSPPANAWTHTFSLAHRAGFEFFDLHTRADLRAILAHAQASLPNLINQCTSLEKLDALVNGDRLDTSSDPCSIYITGASVVLAYLAGNPNFDIMMAELDGRMVKSEADPIGPALRMREHLLASMTPRF